jgi:hypothetical protein
VQTDTSNWSGEGAFTQQLIESLRGIESIEFVRVEDAPASRSEADYNFISNEIFVRFGTTSHEERGRRFGFLPTRRTVTTAKMTMRGLDEVLSSLPGVGPPDYCDEGMIQYLKSERIVPPYQTKGYKLVELVRIYEVGVERRQS